MHDATIKTQDAHETYEHTQQVANVTHQYGANFCHLVTKTNSNVSSMMDFCEGKKNERLQILKIFLFLKLPYLDNKFQ